MLLPKSPAVGEESAFGHLGRPPTSWPGDPHFAPSAHYILQQTLDGVHPLEKAGKKYGLIRDIKNVKSIHRHKPVVFIPTFMVFRSSGIQSFKAPSSPCSATKLCINQVCVVVINARL